MNKPLNESVSEAINLCDNIEKCLFYGIRIPDFFGTIPFWGLIQRLDAGIHTCNPLRHSIAVISNATQLKTPWMKARCCFLNFSSIFHLDYYSRLYYIFILSELGYVLC
jgi:hypothetical protein